MDLAQLFNPVEKVAGIEIAHGRVYIVLLEKNKKGEIVGTKREAAIPSNIIAENGAILNKQKLASALKTIWGSGKIVLKSKYIIVAIPSTPTFTTVLKFPKVSSEQLNEAIHLYVATKTSFPIDTNEIYYDWEPLATQDIYHESVLLSFVKRSYVNDVVEACEEADLHPIACEASSHSITRSITNFKNKTGILIRITQECVDFSVATDNTLLFTRATTLPASYDFETLKNIIALEALHIINYYTTEYPTNIPISLIALFSSVPQKKDITAHLQAILAISVEDAHFLYNIPLDDSYAVAFGAALRGLMKRDKDTLVSLLPIGTEEAYHKRRFLSYISLWSDIVTATIILFVILFGSMLIFLNVVEKKTITQSALFTASTGQSNMIEKLKQEASRFNSAVGAVNQANDTTILFSAFIEKILPTLHHDGITITAITLPVSGDFRVSAIATTREKAISFRKALESNTLYTKTSIPPLGASQRANIPLDIALSLEPQHL